jgi:hypothetical protein
VEKSVASSRVEISGIREKIANHASKLEKLLKGESSKSSYSIPNVHEQGVLKNLLPSLAAADRVAFGKELMLSGISSDLSDLKSLVTEVLRALDIDDVKVMETYFVGKTNAQGKRPVNVSWLKSEEQVEAVMRSKHLLKKNPLYDQMYSIHSKRSSFIGKCEGKMRSFFRAKKDKMKMKVYHYNVVVVNEKIRIPVCDFALYRVA